LEEQLLGAGLEEPALLHRPVQRDAGLRVGRDRRRHQYAFATNSSWDGKRVITWGPSAVTTTSSSIRAAEKPSDAGQYVSRAMTMPSLISTGWSSELSRL